MERVTSTQIYQHYHGLGYAVKITLGGRISFKEHHDDLWLEGRHVSEYRFDPETSQIILI